MTLHSMLRFLGAHWSQDRMLEQLVRWCAGYDDPMTNKALVGALVANPAVASALLDRLADGTLRLNATLLSMELAEAPPEALQALASGFQDATLERSELLLRLFEEAPLAHLLDGYAHCLLGPHASAAGVVLRRLLEHPQVFPTLVPTLEQLWERSPTMELGNLLGRYRTSLGEASTTPPPGYRPPDLVQELSLNMGPDSLPETVVVMHEDGSFRLLNPEVSASGGPGR